MNLKDPLTSQITPKNINVNLDSSTFGHNSNIKNQIISPKSTFEKNKNNPNFNQSFATEKENFQENTQDLSKIKDVIERIDNMVRSWSDKYKFHTQIDRHSPSDPNNFLLVTEFSAPQMNQPIPDATAKVIFFTDYNISKF